jgi:hypothetical protein
VALAKILFRVQKETEMAASFSPANYFQILSTHCKPAGYLNSVLEIFGLASPLLNAREPITAKCISILYTGGKH